LGLFIIALDGYVRSDGLIFKMAPSVLGGPVMGLMRHRYHASLPAAAFGVLFGVAQFAAVW